MSRLLVTGAAGFIGSNFVRYWLSAKPQDHIVVVDALTYAGNRESISDLLSDRCVFEHCDINNTQRIEALLRDERIDTIVHFAAESHVDRSIEGPDVFLEANILGTHSLLKAARQVWQIENQAPETHRFHHVSTDEVYGALSMQGPAFTEKNSLCAQFALLRQ